jgi:carbonic anhydrase
VTAIINSRAIFVVRVVSIRMVSLLPAVILVSEVLLLSSVTFAEFSHARQRQWPAGCVNDTKRQSPINIITKDVVADENLIELKMEGWDVHYDGTFFNNGSMRSVYFLPGTPTTPSTESHLGKFYVAECHFHWGNMIGSGSEHLIDSDSGELEVHFVHRNEEGGFLVISVIADAENDKVIAGPWEQLDVLRILPVNSSFDVPRFRLDQLLPTDREYFYYQGSLTIPPCTEGVNWFVMKKKITVPTDYLKKLRKVQHFGGEPIGFNYRQQQELGTRVVWTRTQSPSARSRNSHASIVRPIATLIVLLSLVLL